MRTATYVILLALVSVSLSGCGTVCNLVGGIDHPESDPRVFGGVQKDYEVLYALGFQPSGKAAALGWPLITVLTVDPMLSFFGDILTLPITIPLHDSRIDRELEHNRAVIVPPASDEPRNIPPPAPPENLPVVPPDL